MFLHPRRDREKPLLRPFTKLQKTGICDAISQLEPLQARTTARGQQCLVSDIHRNQEDLFQLWEACISVKIKL